MTQEERISICRSLRERTARSFAEGLKAGNNISEADLTEHISKDLLDGKKVHARGWYSPPPTGTAVLFGAKEDGFARLLFDTLRKEEFWPHQDHRFEDESAGILYASPVDRASGAIGDFDCTVYRGKDEKIKKHMLQCLNVMERVAEFATVGMEFRELHDFSQDLMREQGLDNHRTVTITDNIGTNIGHTIPWSHEDPTEEELRVITGSDPDALRNLISSKRIYLNREEKFMISPTIAFTAELRMERSGDPSLPNVFFHMIVSFVDGKKEISGDFDPVFEAIGMDSYIMSKY